MCNGLFGGNSCTWVLILVIIFLLSQNNSTYSNDGDCGCSNYNNTRSCC